MDTKKPELWEKYSDTFKLSWDEARTYFDKANDDIELFEAEPNLKSTSLSDISLAQARMFVDQALPAIVARLFGSDNPFELLPNDTNITYETARNVRDWILYNMMTTMRLETEGYLTIREAVKLGCGYGIIEPQLITPPRTEELIVYTENETVTANTMDVGEVEMVPNYVYIPFGQVIPTPDGKNPDEVSCVFVLRFYPEEVFRKMLDKKLNPNTPFTGDADKIIEYARMNSLDGYIRSPRQIAAQIANQDKSVSDRMNQRSSKNTPVSVPVLQCYSRDEHVWFACDQFQIYHKKNKFQTLRCPVVKATFDPDGNNWFTPGIIRPRASMIRGIEAFYNGVLDMVTLHLHPHQIINADALQTRGEAPDLQPYGKTVITGTHRTSDVVTWVAPPPVPPFLLEIGERLENHDAASVGQPKQLFGQGTPGLVRGGSGAMESLLQSSTGREKLAASHFEKGWYAAVIENTLILAQMIAKDKELLPKLQYNPATSKNEFGFVEITRDDIRHVYKLQLNFTDKMSNALAELQKNSMIYDRAVQNRFVNQKEAFALLVGNTKQYRQLTEGVNPQENLQAMQVQGNVPRGTSAGSEEEMTIPGGAGITMGGLAQ